MYLSIRIIMFNFYNIYVIGASGLVGREFIKLFILIIY
jgi:hypothetical protein